MNYVTARPGWQRTFARNRRRRRAGFEWHRPGRLPVRVVVGPMITPKASGSQVLFTACRTQLDARSSAPALD